MAAEDAFSTELRGYKKDEVDQVVQKLRAELAAAQSDKAEQAKEMKRLQAVAEDLQAELDEVGSPTYSGLGTKLENTLRVAEEQSLRLISQADIDAERLRASVQAELAEQRAEVEAHAARVTADAQAQVDAHDLGQEHHAVDRVAHGVPALLGGALARTHRDHDGPGVGRGGRLRPGRLAGGRPQARVLVALPGQVGLKAADLGLEPGDLRRLLAGLVHHVVEKARHGFPGQKLSA